MGSGKSVLLNTILGELPIDSGSIVLNGRLSYCCQTPWLFEATVQQNILFGEGMDLERYKRVIEVCQLEADIKSFPFGDKTRVGERGNLLLIISKNF